MINTNFNNIPIDKKIQKVLSSDRIPHAILISGSRGIGKLLNALKLSKALVCKNLKDGIACSNCPSCRKADKLIHPDIHYTFPTIGKDALSDSFLNEWRSMLLSNPFSSITDWIQKIDAEKKKQGNINKAECKNIIKKINLKAFEGGNKVSIIWLPEFLGKEGNRLLKLIEEPPENSYFIFVCNDTDKLLGTIISRCQIIGLTRFSEEETEKILTQNFGANESEVKTIVTISDGNLNLGIKMIESGVDGNFERLTSFLRISYAGNQYPIFELCDELSKLPKQELKSFLEYFAHFLRECLRLNYLPKESLKLQAKELDFANKFSSFLTPETIELMSERISENTYYIERNANIKLLLITLSIELSKTFKKNMAVA